ncbi:hypothetical protein ARMSODRAFT_1009476 [Armillaria solidipes]|uniref:MFS general substrate transporter n=1 Tax=Armillaria solidipes TaxID=1076256 RepID=A0A2H3ATH8_9AGAR|nr:hypothetical protein ARMSODRAFT_1009476 [Armillaria solidipes]
MSKSPFSLPGFAAPTCTTFFACAPLVLGHESTGVITAVEPLVTHLRPGLGPAHHHRNLVVDHANGAGILDASSIAKPRVTMMCVVCFMGPGLFNALNGLEADGQVDSKTNSNVNTALYSTFAAMGFFAGSVNNMLGPKVTLLIGSIGYSLYIGSYLPINIHSNAGGFVVAAGAILGMCAGLLWTAQGSLMMAYPTETQKGRFIDIFWSIFNLGGVVGASVAAGRNWKSTANAVDDGTYIGFLVLTLIGVLIPMLMANPDKMIRSDGTKTDPMITLLFPMFFASNWFYTWQSSGFNGAIFSIRARGLNNICYWISQTIGSILIVVVFRAYTGWTVLVWFYMFCGFLRAMWQTVAYWLMGAILNDPSKLALFAGFYKSIH